MKLISWVLLSLALACSGRGSDSYDSSNVPPPPQAAREVMLEEAIAVNSPVEREQKIIKESFLRFEASDLNKTYQNIIRFVKENNGYLQNDESTKGYNELTRRLIIRVPIQNFQKTIDSIEKNVAFFDTKTITSTDVTEEFIDLEARLKAKRTLENRYLELLAKANSVKDILEIEKELSTIREEIEAREGRLKYLENRVSYSTLTVEFYKRTSESGITVSYGSKMLNALKSGFNGLSYFFLGILNIWPFIAIMAIIAYIIKRRFFRKKLKP